MSMMYAYSALQAPCGDTCLCCFAGKLSKSADVYAFGVLLWEMYTGQRPWSGLGQMQVIFHLTQRKKRLQFPSDTPPQLQVLLFSFLHFTSSAAAPSSPSSAAAPTSPSCPPLLLLLPFSSSLAAAAAAAAAAVPWSLVFLLSVQAC